VIKLRRKRRRMRWVWHVACMGKSEIYTKFLSENLKGKDHLEYLHVDGRTILEWILMKETERVWTGFICLRTEPMAVSCEHE
jgi:hypothetical protein